MKKNQFICTVLFSLSFALFSQEALKSIEEEYYDFLSLQGITERPYLNYRTLSDSEWNIKEDENTSHPWEELNLGTKKTLKKELFNQTNWFLKGINNSVNLKIYGPEWFNSFNTTAPYGQNDGALWQGKGYNTSLTLGARFEALGFEITLKPQVCFSQNLEFEYLPGKYDSEYSYFYTEGGNIDFVQRYGDKSFWNFDFGDTEIRWTLHNFTIGFGNQSPWLGPSYLNPMLGSNNAPTYPKFDIGLRKTKIVIPGINWHFGDIEARLWTGLLKESDYFDNNPNNNKNMLNALSISFSPSFIPGLTIGLNRIFLTKWKTENLKYIGRLFTLSRSNDVKGEGEDQKFSITADFCFPKIGFEVYGEFGRDDFSSDEVSNPFHTAIYTIGAKQIIPLPVQWLKFQFLFEWNNFEMSQDFQMQWQYKGYYSHGKITQGYTNKGQILGAGTGFFGNSQFLGLKAYFPKGSAMFLFHRHCPDNNYIYNKTVGKPITSTAPEYDQYYASFMTYRTFSLSGNYFITNNFILDGEIAYTIINNNYYNKNNDKQNFRFTLTVKYNF